MVLIIISCKMFEFSIITSTIHFVGIVHHCIILHCMLVFRAAKRTFGAQGKVLK